LAIHSIVGSIGVVIVALIALLIVGGKSGTGKTTSSVATTKAPSAHSKHHAASTQVALRERLTSIDSWSDVAHNFRNDWSMLWKEITIGFLLAGFVGQLPDSFFNSLFLTHAPAGVKLVENAIDAGADRIEITLHDGGQTLIAVADNGGGMTADELALAVERHCTSKLPDDNLLEIAALGFRGEALPSIGAVSRLRIVSRPPGADSAWEIRVEAGDKHVPVPAAYPAMPVPANVLMIPLVVTLRIRWSP